MINQELVKNLLDEISNLQQRYIDAFDILEDSKALQGVERCIELKMKICGIDGKQTIENNAPSPEIAIDLTKISSTALREILQASNKN